MNIPYVRLDVDVCDRMNDLAAQERRTVSELVNEMLGSRLAQLDALPTDGAPAR